MGWRRRFQLQLFTNSQVCVVCFNTHVTFGCGTHFLLPFTWLCKMGGPRWYLKQTNALLCLIVDKLEFGSFVKHVWKAYQLLFCQRLVRVHTPGDGEMLIWMHFGTAAC